MLFRPSQPYGFGNIRGHADGRITDDAEIYAVPTGEVRMASVAEAYGPLGIRIGQGIGQSVGGIGMRLAPIEVSTCFGG